METVQVEIINPKAIKLLSDLAELNLIAIKDVSKNKLASVLKTGGKSLPGKSSKKISIDETYPFRPQYLKFNDTNYILREKLNGIVSLEEGYYSIANELLDIIAWGKTRDEAEEAFAFTFHSLYENFAKEEDKKLTPKAKRLKQTLQHLVVNIIS